MKELKGLTLEQITTIMLENKFPKFRASQIFEWIYKKRCTSFDEMLNVPKEIRNFLSENYLLNLLEIVEKPSSKQEGTVKYLFKTVKGHFIEAVLLPEESRTTICLSTQVGCPLDCKFCATGFMGYKMNLSAGEIFEQLALVEKDSGKTITNIVYMGMGEPLLNLDATIASLKLFIDEKSCGISSKRITVSTAGITTGIKELKDCGLKPKLALSLHSAIDSIRNKIMPINEKYCIDEVIAACKEYAFATETKITFEYVMLKGINDRAEDRKALVRLCSLLPSKVNIIPFNSLAHIAPDGLAAELEPTPRNEIEDFANHLRNKNITVMLRNTQGQDIAAACGQLAVEKLHRRK